MGDRTFEPRDGFLLTMFDGRADRQLGHASILVPTHRPAIGRPLLAVGCVKGSQPTPCLRARIVSPKSGGSSTASVAPCGATSRMKGQAFSSDGRSASRGRPCRRANSRAVNQAKQGWPTHPNPSGWQSDLDHGVLLPSPSIEQLGPPCRIERQRDLELRPHTGVFS